MKKNYVVPRTTSVDVVTENDFALVISNVTGQGTGRGSDLPIYVSCTGRWVLYH